MSAATKEREATMGRPYRTMEPSGEPRTALELRHVAKSFDDFAVRDAPALVPCGSVVGSVEETVPARRRSCAWHLARRGLTGALLCCLDKTSPRRGRRRTLGCAYARQRLRPYARILAILRLGSRDRVRAFVPDVRPRCVLEALLDRMDIMHQPEGAHRPVSAGLRVGDLSRGQGMKLQLAVCLATERTCWYWTSLRLALTPSFVTSCCRCYASTWPRIRIAPCWCRLTSRAISTAWQITS